ncbi:MAG: 2-hydroxyacyl-CoA dehydratase [Deltaproteobacteria bacterium]|nr:2-hydroxyacyl-CoA dehydratase [Deltaproteobacteria bacterium]
MRASYIREQRERFGRRAVAVLPVHYPKPLLTAAGLLAVELWGPPGPPRGSDAGRLQPYVCAIVRNALAFMASGGLAAVDGVLFPHTCDSIQGLATLAPDFGGLDKPALRYQHARGERRPSAVAFLVDELRLLADALAALSGRAPDGAAIDAAIELHLRIDDRRRALLRERRRLPHTDRELYALLRRGEYLWPADHLAELEAAAAQLQPAPVQRGTPIMITGYVPEPAALLDVLGAAGALVVADDYAGIGRRLLPRLAAPPSDPFAHLAELAFVTPPCPTRGDSQARRLRHLDALFDQGQAAGVIIHVVKFCEPELFDVPAIHQHFAARGAPVLVIEGELESELSGQAATRLEAFVEMVQQARGTA